MCRPAVAINACIMQLTEARHTGPQADRESTMETLYYVIPTVAMSVYTALMVVAFG